jgi:hypothetical protein
MTKHKPQAEILQFQGLPISAPVFFTIPPPTIPFLLPLRSFSKKPIGLRRFHTIQLHKA